MDRLLEIGKKYNLPVIEDSAEALGSYWNKKHTGTVGTFGAFSFHGTKTMTTGEGGMFVTNDELLYEKVLTLSNHGRSRKQKKQFWPEMVGYKYKMSNIQAALGCAQMERIDELVFRKREIFSYYKQGLKEFDGISMNPEVKETKNSYWMPVAVFDDGMNIDRDALIEAFNIESIDARVFFYPLSSMPMFDKQSENTVAIDIANRAINLPSYHDMMNKDQDKVISVIQALVRTSI